MSLIESLQNSALYDHPVESFELVETHISWVILTGEYVYKIKKPVNFGFLDFSTLEKRRHYCEEEVRLNSRLAPQLYLGVTSINGSAENPQINGQGSVLEYAVKMRQFPQSTQLDRLLSNYQLNNTIMDKLATKVADFHLSISSVSNESSYGDLEHIAQPVLENFAHIRECISDSTITPTLDKIESWSRQQLNNLSDNIRQRKEQGFVRECHGDMHLRNIALWNDEIVIFDCIEFNKNFYWIDVMSEIAFLVMDLEDRQQEALARRFLNSYLEITGDYEGLQLLRFYKVYRAMVRAKVDALRVGQEQAGSEEYNETLNDFRQYLNLADSYTVVPEPLLLINCGLSGSGKSVGTQLLLDKLPAIQVRSDIERKRLYGIDISNHQATGVGKAIYSKEATNKTYSRLQNIAELLLKCGLSVVIDAANLKISQRQIFEELASSLHVPYFIIVYSAPEYILMERVKQRSIQGDDVSDATLEVLQHQLENAEPLTEGEKQYSIEIDTSNGIDIDAIVMKLVKR